MKNPFEKNDHKVLIAGIVIGTAVAGAVAYLFLTETGAQVRQQLTGHIDRMRDAFLGAQPEEEPAPSEPEPPKPKGKAPKTDREKIMKDELVPDPAAPHVGGGEEQQS